jgi:hypothetical protein
MTRDLAKYLGLEIGELLVAMPFSSWHPVRSVENDPRPEVWYEFEGHGVEVICDEDDRIRTVFLHRGDGESLVDVPFGMTRQQVRQRFGVPAASGAAVRIAGIGDLGPWDRFALAEGVLHIQYSARWDEIDMVTLMRPDAVPGAPDRN